MAEDSTGASSTHAGKSDDSAKKRRTKKILIAAASVVGGLGLLVLLAPTLLSTGAGKSLVLGQVNNNLNGRIEVDSWSLGWFSGIELTGVKVLDDQKRTAITLGRLRTDLTVLKAATGNYDLGETTLDNVNLVTVELNRTPAGITSNFDRLVKQDPAAKPSAPASSSAPSKLPALRGNVTIKNLTGTIQGTAVGPQPLRIGDSAIALKIPDIQNKPVANDVRLVVGRDDAGMGTVTLTGDVQAIFAGVVDATQLTANESLKLDNLDLSAANAFLTGLELGGLATGGIDVKLAGTDTLDAMGEIRVAGLSVGGDALAGDRYTSRTLSLPVSVSSAAGAVKIDQLGLVTDDATVSVTGAATRTALTNLAAMKPPGSPGSIVVRVAVPDIAAVAAKLPNTIPLHKGVTLTGGALASAIDVAIDPAGAALTGRTTLDNVRGTRDGRPVALSPIAADYDVKAGMTDAGLTSLVVNTARLDSAFAKADASGTLDDLKYTADVSLDRARDEVAQFLDLGGVDLAGRLTSNGTLRGAAGDQLTAESNTTLDGVRVRLPGKDGTPATPPTQLDVDRLVAGLSATVRKQSGTYATADLTRLAIEVGPQASPALRLDAVATADLTTGDVPSFDLRRLEAASLPELQRRFGGLVPALAQQGLTLSSGSLRAGVAGSYKGGTLVMSRPLSAELQNLTLLKQGRPLLQNETLTLAAAGQVATAPSPAPSTRIELTALDVTSSTNLVQLRQSGDKLLIDLKPDGSLAGGGGVTFSADLARLSSLASAYSATPADPATTVRSGRAGGQLAFGQQGAEKGTDTSVTGNVDLTALTVGSLLTNETAALTFKLASPDAFKSLAGDANVRSAFATVDATKLKLRPSADVWNLVQFADLKVRSDDLAKVDALLKALAPPPAPLAPAAPGTPPAAPDLPPLYVRSGKLDLSVLAAKVEGGTNVEVQTFQVTDLELSRGTASFRMPAPIDLKLHIAATGDASKGDTVAQQLQSLTVSDLGGSLGVATIKLDQPYVMSDLSAAVPTVRGKISAAGRVQTVTALLEVLSAAQPGTLYPYLGDFTLTQELSTASGALSAVGSAAVNNLQVLERGGRNGVVFTENRLEITNDLRYTAATADVLLRTLSVNTASSGALNVTATGSIKDAGLSRRIDEPLKLKLKYDLAKVMPLVVPLLSPDTQALLKGATFAGQFERDFVVTGAYPANLPPEQAIRQLKATGGLGVAQATLPVYGLELSAFEPAFSLDNGVATLAMPQPAGLNGGSLDLAGAVVDLREASPRLDLPDRKALLANVSLNQALARRLGKYASVFANANDASGRLNVTVYECKRLPLGELLTARTPDNDGRASISITSTQFGITGGLLGDFVNKLPGVKDLAAGELNKCDIGIANGIATQDVDMRLTVGSIKMKGNIELDSNRFAPLTIYVGPAAVGSLLGPLKNVGGLADIPIVVEGTVEKPRFDVGASVRDYVVRNAKNLGGLPGDLGRLLGGGGNAQPPAQTPPPTPPPAPQGQPPANPPGVQPQPPQTPPPSTRPRSPLDELGGLLQRERDKEAEKKRRKEQQK